MAKISTIILFILSNLSLSEAQLLQFENQIILQFDIHGISIDSEGQLYLASKKGDLFKYDERGDSVLAFSPGKNAQITLIEASRGLKVFLFYRDFQEFVFLDRFLRPSPYYRFNPNLVGFAGLSTISTDENLWVLDPTDFSLKKYNSRSNQIEISSSLSQIIPVKDYEITYMKEYNNMLFIVNSNKAVYVFDNLGNYQKVMNIPNIERPGFIGNDMYFIKNDKISLINVYTGQSTDIQIPSEPFTAPDAMKMFKKTVYLFEKRKILIYSIL